MKKYLVLVVAVLASTIFVGCDSDEFNEPNYVSFQRGPANLQVDFGGSATQEVTVYTADVSGSDRTFDIVVADASTLSSAAYTVPSSVTVPGGSNEGVITIDVADIDISPNGETLVLGFAPRENGFTGANLTINVRQFCDPQLVFAFKFDSYASETTWQVEDSEGNVVLTGGPWANGTATANVGRCLAPGDYVFTIYDEYADGLTYNGVIGSVTISYNGEELGFVDGDFGAEGSVPFTLDY